MLLESEKIKVVHSSQESDPILGEDIIIDLKKLEVKSELLEMWRWRSEGCGYGTLVRPMHRACAKQFATAIFNEVQCSTDSTVQHSTAQHSTAQHSTAQHSTAQHSTAQH